MGRKVRTKLDYSVGQMLTNRNHTKQSFHFSMYHPEGSLNESALSWLRMSETASVQLAVVGFIFASTVGEFLFNFQLSFREWLVTTVFREENMPHFVYYMATYEYIYSGALLVKIHTKLHSLRNIFAGILRNDTTCIRQQCLSHPCPVNNCLH